MIILTILMVLLIGILIGGICLGIWAGYDLIFNVHKIIPGIFIWISITVVLISWIMALSS